jgi:uncharacterized protein YdhG (YjbR/CyaY superfamily)
VFAEHTLQGVKPMKTKPTSVADYIAKSPPESRKSLKALRALVRAAAPRATEKISYGIPTFVLDGKYLVYIAGWRNHVSMYPVTAGMTRTLKKEIARYQTGKGTLQFPLADPIPKSLIKKIIKVRVDEAARGR